MFVKNSIFRGHSCCGFEHIVYMNVSSSGMPCFGTRIDGYMDGGFEGVGINHFVLNDLVLGAASPARQHVIV